MYIDQNNVVYSGPQRAETDRVATAAEVAAFRRSWLERHGFTLPDEVADSELQTAAGAMAIATPPIITEEWHETAIFAEALDALLGSDEVKAAVAQNWKTTKFAIQVPPDRVNLLDPRIELFAAEIGLTVADIRAKIEELENA